MPAPIIAWVGRRVLQEVEQRVGQEVNRRVGQLARRLAIWVPIVTVAIVLIAAFAPIEQARAGSCGPGLAVPTSADIPPSMMTAINALKADYEAAGAATGVAWSALAAIDYRENNNDPTRSALSGEPIGATNPDSGAVTSSKRDSLVRAGEHIKMMAESVYGVILTPDSGGVEVQQAFVAYNRGSSYKTAGLEAAASPYVMSQYDAAHKDMVFPSIPGEPLAGMTDYRLGAYTVFGRLGGATGSCGLSDDEIVRIAQEQLGLMEVPDGCNCGPEIQKFLGSSAGEEWCADFVSWVYREAGRPFTGGLDGGWRIINVEVMHGWHEANGLWFPAGSAEDPRPGDVITFRDDGHVGIVERLDDSGTPDTPGDDRVLTIEGNTSNRVARRDYARTGGEIVGWGRRK